MKSSKSPRKRILVLLLALGAVTAHLGAAQEPTRGPSQDLQIDCEPLVVYDVSGYGIAGPIHRHLAVYSDGLASFSSLTLNQLSVDMTRVTAERARTFNDDLIAAGALELGDRVLPGTADIPLTTVTAFNGSGPDAVYNVFSFFETEMLRDYQAIVGIVQAFIDEVFTGNDSWPTDS